MKNSRISQIIVIVLLAISTIVLFFATFGSNRLRHQIWRSTTACCILFAIMIGALIYYIVMSNEKKISIIISIIAVGIELLVTFARAYYILYGKSQHVTMSNRWRAMWNNWMIPTHVVSGGVFLATAIIFLALLITFIKTKPIVQCKKEEINYTKPYTTVSSEIYCGMAKHVLLLLFTFGIWYYIWIYRMTGYTNAAENEEYRNPTKKLLLCLFIPFYIIYWTYKTAQRVDKMAASKGISSDMATLCLTFAIFVPIIPPILLQDKMNNIATANDTQYVSTPKGEKVNGATLGTAEELKNFKELLDSGVITQEEFEAKKKQLLGL